MAQAKGGCDVCGMDTQRLTVQQWTDHINDCRKKKAAAARAAAAVAAARAEVDTENAVAAARAALKRAARLRRQSGRRH